MVFVWGSRLYGKSDVVPGLFHVATKFGHLWYIPLIPTESWIVTRQDGESWNGVPISMSIKSILLAWGRAFLIFTGAASTLMAIMLIADGKKHESPTGSIVSAAVIWGLLIVSYLPFVTRASFNRAMALGRVVGMNAQGMAAIEQIYGQSAGRGFAVTPTAMKPGASAAQSRRPKPVDDGGAIPLEPSSPPKPVAKKPVAPTPTAQKRPPQSGGRIGLS